MQEIIDNDVTLDDNDIYTADIDKQQRVEIARERSPVASNGSGDVIITTAQLHSTKPELRFCVGSNPARGVSKICDGEDL